MLRDERMVAFVPRVQAAIGGRIQPQDQAGGENEKKGGSLLAPPGVPENEDVDRDAQSQHPDVGKHHGRPECSGDGFYGFGVGHTTP